MKYFDYAMRSDESKLRPATLLLAAAFDSSVDVPHKLTFSFARAPRPDDAQSV